MQKLTEIQEEFIHLLETTDQPQGQKALATAEGFCCLGLWTAYKGVKLMENHFFSRLSLRDKECAKFENKEVIKLSQALTDELRLYTETGGGRDNADMALTALNDGGKTFKEIAQIVRANPQDYFKP